MACGLRYLTVVAPAVLADSAELLIICLGQNLQRGHSLRDASAHGCQGAEDHDIVCQPCLLTWSQLLRFSTFAFFI